MAAVVATIVLMAVAAALTAGISANRTIKGNEQATGLANRVIEDARNTQFDNLILKTDTAAFNDPTNGLTSPSAGVWNYQSAPGIVEPIEHATNGPFLLKNVISDPALGVTFTVHTYITKEDTGTTTLGGGLNKTRRVTAIVSYKRDGATFSAKSSTVITRTRRGLPEPKFEITPLSQTVPAAQDYDLVLSHTIRNLGVTDTYDFDPPTAARSSWNSGLLLYADTNESGLYEAGVDQLLVDTNGNGKVDTGTVPTSGTAQYFLVYHVPATEANGNVAVTTKISSGAHSTVFQTISDVAQVTFEWDRYFLYNQALFADEPVDSGLTGTFSNSAFPFPMPMDPRTPSETDATGGTIYWNHLPDYATNQSDVTGPGRPVWPAAAVVAANGTLNSTTARTVAVWEHKVLPTAVSPTPTFGPYWWTQLYLANPGTIPCDTDIKVRMYLNKVTGNGATSATGTFTVTTLAQKAAVIDMSSAGSASGSTCEFKNVFFGISTVPTTVISNAWLQLRIVVDETTATRTAPVMLSYGPWFDIQGNRNVNGPSLIYVSRQS